MKRLLKPRYYCDYCKKSGASGSHMSQHEKRCTLNPKRECRVCKHVADDAAPLAELIVIADKIAVDRISDEDGLKMLSKAAGGCPACMLSAIRQSTKIKELRDIDTCFINVDGNGSGCLYSFDYKAEMKKVWKEVNADYKESVGGGYY